MQSYATLILSLVILSLMLFVAVAGAPSGDLYIVPGQVEAVSGAVPG
jgi:hypothetical protein